MTGRYCSGVRCDTLPSVLSRSSVCPRPGFRGGLFGTHDAQLVRRDSNFGSSFSTSGVGPSKTALPIFLFRRL